MGKKYIIELPENTHWIQWIMEGTKDHHPYMDFKQVEDLTPYAEPDLEQVRKEEFENGYENGFVAGHLKAEKSGQSFYEDGYKRGLADAWEAARKIANMPYGEEEKVFGSGGWTFIEKHTAYESIEKIRQYEQEKEEQITKGDIVLIKSTPEVEILATYADEEYVSGIALTEVDDNCEIGDQYTDIRICNVEKTGKHYDIVSVLAKMKEASDG